jgi:Fe2+ or Zn2+ uptake regulation protein
VSAPTAERTARLLDRLRAGGGRRTALRAVLLDVLGAAGPEHLTVAEIHHRVADRGIPGDQSAIYRALDRFMDLGITHVLNVPGPPAYGLADHAHHHAVCDRCGAIVEIPVEGLVAVTESIAAASHTVGFRARAETVTVQGQCARCAA